MRRGLALGITYLLGRDGLLASLAKLFDRLGVVTQILFATNQDDGKTLAEMKNLGNPLRDEKYARISFCSSLYADKDMHSFRANLFLNVVQGIRGVDSKADEDNVRIGV